MGDFLSLSQMQLHRDVDTTAVRNTIDTAICATSDAIGLDALRAKSQDAVSAFTSALGLEGHCQSNESFVCSPLIAGASIADIVEESAIAQVNAAMAAPAVVSGAALLASAILTGGAIIEGGAIATGLAKATGLASIMATVLSSCTLFETQGVFSRRGTHEANAVGGTITIFSEGEDICFECDDDDTFCGRSEAYPWSSHDSDLEVDMLREAVIDAISRLDLNGRVRYFYEPIAFIEHFEHSNEPPFIRWYHEENTNSEPEDPDALFQITVGFTREQMTTLITDPNELKAKEKIEHVEWDVCQ